MVMGILERVEAARAETRAIGGVPWRLPSLG